MKFLILTSLPRLVCSQVYKVERDPLVSVYSRSLRFLSRARNLPFLGTFCYYVSHVPVCLCDINIFCVCHKQNRHQTRHTPHTHTHTHTLTHTHTRTIKFWRTHGLRPLGINWVISLEDTMWGYSLILPRNFPNVRLVGVSRFVGLSHTPSHNFDPNLLAS
jgi:hypothetical protein